MIFNINSTHGQMRFLTCVAWVTCLVNDNPQAKKHERRSRASLRHYFGIKILDNFFLSDTLAIRLLGSSFTFSFASSCCLIYKFISKLRITMHVVMN